jgi:hypothetical protein
MKRSIESVAGQDKYHRLVVKMTSFTKISRNGEDYRRKLQRSDAFTGNDKYHKNSDKIKAGTGDYKDHIQYCKLVAWNHYSKITGCVPEMIKIA